MPHRRCTALAAGSWQAVLPASWDAQPVWFHGEA